MDPLIWVYVRCLQKVRGHKFEKQQNRITRLVGGRWRLEVILCWSSREGHRELQLSLSSSHLVLTGIIRMHQQGHLPMRRCRLYDQYNFIENTTLQGDVAREHDRFVRGIPSHEQLHV